MTYRNTEVWAQLHLCNNDCHRLREFFSTEFGISRKFILREMHITVYYSRRPMPRIKPLVESIELIIPAKDTRFMVMTPGGENPRPEIDPAKHMIGIRIHRKSLGMPKLLKLRHRMLLYETSKVLGSRRPSSDKRNAFGSRWFQAHMVILRPGATDLTNLSKIGIPFRKKFGKLEFDKFEIKITHRENMRGSYNQSEK